MAKSRSKKTKQQPKKVVAIGGGTGTPVVLRGLKNNPNIALSAIVVVTDSGGSTGRLKDEFGFLPVGDIRQCITALAADELQEEIRQLLLYRFGGGSSLKGHSLGNLIITAFEDIKDSPSEAIKDVSKIFRTKGNIYPVSEVVADLIIEYEDGSTKTGEHFLDDHAINGKKIAKLSLSKESELYEEAERALTAADTIILGPGDLYGSLIPHSLAKGFKEAMQQSAANFVYIVNLMTHFSQTHQMTATDHVQAVAEYFGKKPAVVIVNDGPIPKDLLAVYAKQKEYPVVDDLTEKSAGKIIRGDFISEVSVKPNSNDELKRSLLRHDQEKLAKVLQNI
jgi:uncharacterized cofD-like protein